LNKWEADVEVNIGICQQGEDEHKISYKSSRGDEAAARRWSGWAAPKNCLGFKWISTIELGSS
jgi:hypothetical protein